MTINVDLTHEEYISLLVAVRKQMETYEQKMGQGKYQEYWEMAHKETETLLKKLYEAENPT